MAAFEASLPPWHTVYGWFRRCIEKGLFESLMRALARRRCGRRSEPRLAIIDTQSIKCIRVRGPRGYDGAKKLVGRKRVVLVDAEGHALTLVVVPAIRSVRSCKPGTTPRGRRPVLTALPLGNLGAPGKLAAPSFRRYPTR